MTSSSVPTDTPVDISTISAPEGWTNNEACMERSDWAGNPDDIKDMMRTDYGLEDAEPIWRHDPGSGSFLFIFRAKADGKASYYVWNGIESSVCRIVAQEIGEIRRTINDGKGYLKGLEQVIIEL